MTREEAIEFIAQSVKSDVDMALVADAIKALEQEPCEDAISRQEVLDLIADYDLSMGQVVRGIHTLPSVTSQPRKGHWITTRTLMHDGEYYCDKCKNDSPNNEKWDYCPYCGAKMMEREDNK